MLSELFRSGKKEESLDRDVLLELLTRDAFKLEEEERNILVDVLALQDRVAREIMVPRLDMITLNENDSCDRLIGVVAKHGHSRFPLVAGDADTVVGIVYAKDFLGKSAAELKEKRLRECKREAFFVPETKKVLELLRDFQLRRIHLAIVVDEYGGVSGLVSMEDILEMFVGDIQDEYDNEEQQIKKVRKNLYNLDARISVAEANEHCGAALPEDMADTMGGLFMELFGSVPEKNEYILHQGHKLRVLSMDGNRINRMQLTVPAGKGRRTPKAGSNQ